MGRSRNFFQGGGGGGGGEGPCPTASNGQRIFFSPQLILQFIEGVQWFDYRENYSLPRIQREFNIFQGGGGVQLFPGGGGGGVLIIIF